MKTYHSYTHWDDEVDKRTTQNIIELIKKKSWSDAEKSKQIAVALERRRQRRALNIARILSGQ